MSDPEKVEGIVLIPGPTREYLNERQLIAYKNHRKEYIKWLTRMGKDPDKIEGYAYDTARNYASIIDKFHRWAWEHRGGYTLDLDHDHADSYIKQLVLSDKDYSDTHLHNVSLSLKAYFRYRDDIDEWEPSMTISSFRLSGNAPSRTRDWVGNAER